MSSQKVVELYREAAGGMVAYFNGNSLPARSINADWQVGEPLELTLTISGRFVSLVEDRPTSKDITSGQIDVAPLVDDREFARLTRVCGCYESEALMSDDGFGGLVATPGRRFIRHPSGTHVVAVLAGS